MAFASRFRWFIVAGLALAGCAGTSTPNWHYPGPAEYQRRQAERFDPYPENDLAPPVEGGRPPGFETPRAEVTRAAAVAAVVVSFRVALLAGPTVQHWRDASATNSSSCATG